MSCRIMLLKIKQESGVSNNKKKGKNMLYTIAIQSTAIDMERLLTTDFVAMHCSLIIVVCYYLRVV